MRKAPFVSILRDTRHRIFVRHTRQSDLDDGRLSDSVAKVANKVNLTEVIAGRPGGPNSWD